MCTTKSSVIVILLCYVNVKTRAVSPIDDTEGFYWRDYNGGAVPRDAYPGGTNANGNPTYIGQILHHSLLIPAKIDPEQNKVTYEWGYKEFVTNQNIKIFCTKHPEKFEWLHTGNGLIDNINAETLVIGGFEPGAKIYIGRKELDKQLVLGKIIKGSTQTTLNTTKNGTGTQHAEFDVLSYQADKNRKEPDHQPMDIDTRIEDNKTSGKVCHQHVTVINMFY